MNRICFAAFFLGCSIVCFVGCGGSKEPAAQNTSGGGYLDAVSNARQKAAMLESMNNLKEIGMAFQAYHDAFNYLPSNKSQPGKAESWRVQLLPFLKLDPKQYGPQKMPAIFINPRWQKKEDHPTATYYRCFVGGDGKNGSTVIGSMTNVSLVAITNANGTSNTILVVEAGEPVPWMSLEELELDPRKPVPPLGGPKREDFLALFCDQHVQKLPAKMDEKVLRLAPLWNNSQAYVLP